MRLLCTTDVRFLEMKEFARKATGPSASQRATSLTKIVMRQRAFPSGSIFVKKVQPLVIVRFSAVCHSLRSLPPLFLQQSPPVLMTRLPSATPFVVYLFLPAHLLFLLDLGNALHLVGWFGASAVVSSWFCHYRSKCNLASKMLTVKNIFDRPIYRREDTWPTPCAFLPVVNVGGSNVSFSFLFIRCVTTKRCGNSNAI